VFRGGAVTGYLGGHQSVKWRGRWIRATLTLMAFSVFAQTLFAQTSPIRSISQTKGGIHFDSVVIRHRRRGPLDRLRVASRCGNPGKTSSVTYVTERGASEP
jgi:hypothetical protein